MRLHESDGMFARRRRNAGKYSLPRLADTTARLVEFDLYVKDERGPHPTQPVPDPDHPARPPHLPRPGHRHRVRPTLAEIAYYRIKVTLRGNGVVLRGQTPNLAKQEIWALLCVYNALCDLATETAVSLGLDPDQISFVAVLRLTRAHTSTTHACTCGSTTDAIDALQAATAAYPTNAPADNGPAPEPIKNAEPNEPATSHTRSTSPCRIYPD